MHLNGIFQILEPFLRVEFLQEFIVSYLFHIENIYSSVMDSLGFCSALLDRLTLNIIESPATNGPEACKYISQHSEAKVVVCEGVKQLEKFYTIAKDLKKLKALVVYGPDSIPSDIKKKVSIPVYKFDDFLKLGESVSDATLQSRMDDQKPNEMTSLIYTSGTTGPPKAVMLTHDNITWTAQAQLSTMGQEVTNDDHIISYLPLSHIAAQMLDMHCAMATGLQIWFAQPDALRGSLGVTLKDVRPTIFFGVPRVWEKIYDKMQQVAKQTTGIKKMISGFAKGQATSHWQANQYGSEESEPYFYPVAQILLKKVREALGLDRVSLSEKWRIVQPHLIQRLDCCSHA